jgi:hypothetical protein
MVNVLARGELMMQTSTDFTTDQWQQKVDALKISKGFVDSLAQLTPTAI